MEGSQNKSHENHIAGRGVNSLSHYSLVRKFIPMPSSNENIRCKGSSGEIMEKTGQNAGIEADESQNRMEKWPKQGIRAELYILRH